LFRTTAKYGSDEFTQIVSDELTMRWKINGVSAMERFVVHWDVVRIDRRTSAIPG
jgi:hypothetical protein